MSVCSLAISLPLCNYWSPWRISKKPDTHVNHIETTCRSHVPDGSLQGQGHTYVNQTKCCSHFLIQPFERILPRFAVLLFVSSNVYMLKSKRCRLLCDVHCYSLIIRHSKYKLVLFLPTLVILTLSLRVALSFPINKIHRTKYVDELAYIYYDKCF